MVKWIIGYIVVVMGIFVCSLNPVQAAVEAYETQIEIPTYLSGEPDPNPIFYTGRVYQGAQKRVYPHARYEHLLEKKEIVSYKALVLKNDYIKVVVLPEKGGKLYMARDLSNNYDFIYYNRVMKPGFVGMIGTWTSGGVEWNIPHHHRATSDLPVDCSITEQKDGSKTLWVGEIERRHQTRWTVALTLYPGQSVIRVDMEYSNRSPLANSLLMWANAAVHANENYQVIFPPETQFATYHRKNQFSEWPISHQVYKQIDYTDGYDVSWYKNHFKPVSFFAWDTTGTFLAGYDHGKQAGTVIVSNPYIAPGKKLWSWGPGPKGALWSDLLTDNDGPYIELMAGAYSDNQPDYSWARPFELKPATMYFMPFRKLDGVKAANSKAVLNVEHKQPGILKVGLNVTQQLQNAVVQIDAGTQVLAERRIDLEPGGFYLNEFRIPESLNASDVRVIVVQDTGEEIISYQSAKQKSRPLPKPIEPPVSPEEMDNVEELYLQGLRLQQFYSPNFAPYPYYNEALKRDPGHSQTHTQLGLLYLKRGLYTTAENHFKKAISRLSKNYTTPKDSEPLYYYGLSLMKQGDYKEAYDWLYDASWDLEWHSASHLLMAQIQSRWGNLEHAFEHTKKALETNKRNRSAQDLRLILLRKLGHKEKAIQLARQMTQTDPLSFGPRYEYAKLTDDRSEVKRILREEVQNYLFLASEYAQSGLYEDAIEVLHMAAKHESEQVNEYPLVYYHLGYYYHQVGDERQAEKHFQRGSKLSPRYCFPFRFITGRVLQTALEYDPNDAKAYYYLGNLYYDHQPKAAISYWEKSVQRDSSYARVFRNLAFGYNHALGKPEKSIRAIERAIDLNPNDHRFLLERDEYYALTGVTPEKRLETLKKHMQVVKRRKGTLALYVELNILNGNYDEPIEIMSSTHFYRAEGAGGIHDAWVDAHLLRGKQALEQGETEQALRDFTEARRYPRNLEVAVGDRDFQVDYFLGKAYSQAGHDSKARRVWKRCLSEPYDWSEMRYHQALALRALGKHQAADEIFYGLIAHGESVLQAPVEADFFAKFGGSQRKVERDAEAHYLIGLGYLGLQQSDCANAAFNRALDLNPANLGARIHLRQ